MWLKSEEAWLACRWLAYRSERKQSAINEGLRLKSNRSVMKS
jgi:hypothetical protein